jgi:hypothetical protein
MQCEAACDNTMEPASSWGITDHAYTQVTALIKGELKEVRRAIIRSVTPQDRSRHTKALNISASKRSQRIDANCRSNGSLGSRNSGERCNTGRRRHKYYDLEKHVHACAE